MPLACASAATVVPLRAAIAPSVSPGPDGHRVCAEAVATPGQRGRTEGRDAGRGGAVRRGARRWVTRAMIGVFAAVSSPPPPPPPPSFSGPALPRRPRAPPPGLPRMMPPTTGQDGAMEAAGTLIVGAGLAGSAVAMHLAEMGHDGVVVVDPDLAGVRSSSELNAGGVRATWWQPVNVELCAATIDWFAERAGGVRVPPARLPVAPRPGAVRRGGRRAWGCRTASAGRSSCSPRPRCATGGRSSTRSTTSAGATFSPRDGLVSPNAVREHYRDARPGGGRAVRRPDGGDRACAATAAG